jgi:hypothetical protein
MGKEISRLFKKSAACFSSDAKGSESKEYVTPKRLFDALNRVQVRLRSCNIKK